MWLEEIAKTDFAEFLLRPAVPGMPLPWDIFIPAPELLKKEWMEAQRIAALPVLENSPEEKILYPDVAKNSAGRLAEEKSENLRKRIPENTGPVFNKHAGTKFWVGMRFDKKNLARFISHRDTMRHLEHILRILAFPAAFTKGYSPHFILSLPYPLPLGFSSENDIIDTEATADFNKNELMKQINALSFLQIISIFKNPKKTRINPEFFEYSINLPDQNNLDKAGNFKQSWSEKKLPQKLETERRGKHRILYPYADITDMQVKFNTLDIRSKESIDVQSYLIFLDINTCVITRKII
ncbi:MAG TPA: hypothetical protein DC049_02115 [Spirochaetia bacterium]|nr:hypothetical protein [Spirochaetia bacterium]